MFINGVTFTPDPSGQSQVCIAVEFHRYECVEGISQTPVLPGPVESIDPQFNELIQRIRNAKFIGRLSRDVDHWTIKNAFTYQSHMQLSQRWKCKCNDKMFAWNAHQNKWVTFQFPMDGTIQYDQKPFKMVEIPELGNLNWQQQQVCTLAKSGDNNQ